MDNFSLVQEVLEKGYLFNYHTEYSKSGLKLRYDLKPVISTNKDNEILYSEHKFEYVSQITEKPIIQKNPLHNIFEVVSIEVTENKSIQTSIVVDSFEKYVFYKHLRNIIFNDLYYLQEKVTVLDEKLKKTTGEALTVQMSRKVQVPMTIPNDSKLYNDSNTFHVSVKIIKYIPIRLNHSPMIDEFDQYLRFLLTRQEKLVMIIQSENKLKECSLIPTPGDNRLYSTRFKFTTMQFKYVDKLENLLLVWFKCVECVALLKMYLGISINNITLRSFIFQPDIKNVKIVNLFLCETSFSSIESLIGDFSYNYYEHSYKNNPYAKCGLYNGSDRDLYSLCVLFFNMLAHKEVIYWWEYSSEASDYLKYPFVLICLLFYEMEDVRDKIFKLEDENSTDLQDKLSSELINLFTFFSYKTYITEMFPDKQIDVNLDDEPVYEENESNKSFQSIRNKLLKNDTITINNNKIYVKAYEDDSKLTPGEIDRILLESKDSFQAFLDSKHSKRVKLDDTSAPMVYDSDNLTELSYLSEND